MIQSAALTEIKIINFHILQYKDMKWYDVATLGTLSGDVRDLQITWLAT